MPLDSLLFAFLLALIPVVVRRVRRWKKWRDSEGERFAYWLPDNLPPELLDAVLRDYANSR